MSYSGFTIRPGTPADFPAVLGLIQELALFEKSPEAVINTVDKMKAEQHLFGLYIAEAEGEVIGMALYFFAYYTWVGKSLYLDDLYVKPEWRGRKVGTALLKKAYEVARQEGCSRLRWQVLDWNTGAIAFYKKAGARLSEEWINCDVEGEDLHRF